MAGYSYDRRGNRIRVEIAAHAAGICHSDGRYSRGSITSRRTHLMPQYEMTPEEANRYGSTLNIWQAIRLLQTWSPLITYAQSFLAEDDPYKQGIIIAEATEWVASKTDAKADDELVALLGDLLRTDEGEKLVRWCVAQVEALR